MEAAKNSVKKVLSKSGQHDTTVYEQTAPAVQHETVNPTQHEKITPAVDREVHQEHYHTTEQPVHHKETLPETHHHREAPTERREFKHGDNDALRGRLASEKAQYQDSHVRTTGEATKSDESHVMGEHVHHHVHETIQPVVHKQTIEPHVVHTTKPIHEVHHNEAQHHASTALPAVSMDDFKKQGGSLKGREETSSRFPGEPKSFEGDNLGRPGGVGMEGHGAEPKQTNINPSDRSVGRSGGVGMEGHGAEPKQTNINPSDRSVSTGTEKQKPSLMDRINPKKDSDGDGKAGFMK